MSFGREKRLLLGWLAALAPLPLPFNEVLGWPWLVLFELAMAAFLVRADRDPPGWLPTWAMNVLGGLYLPFFWLDLTVLRQGQLIQPLLHLGLFVVAVKLFALTRERDKWQVLGIVFFLFLAAMGTSVHPSIVLYLVAWLALAYLLLVRLAVFHLLAGFGRADQPPPRIPVGRFVAVCTLVSVVGAIPLFALLPRIRDPVLTGGGRGTTEQASTGFGDEMDLDLTSRLRENREVVARLAFDREPRGEVRLRAITYDLFEGLSWRRSPLLDARSLHLEAPGTWVLVGGRTLRSRAELAGDSPLETAAAAVRDRRQLPRTVNKVQVFLDPLGSNSLPVPTEALSVEGLRRYQVAMDRGGALLLDRAPRDTIAYTVQLAELPTVGAMAPLTAWQDEAALDQQGVTPLIRELASRAMVGTTPYERVTALERFLIENYTYTTDFVGRGGREPLEDFLFRYKSGHCEYFASSMVLLLRSQGIPARLVTGFLGAERNPLQDYYMVRQANAHAWVEAWVEGEGWLTFDPTPPDGRPEATRSAFDLVSQLGDYLVFRWDRYVLSYSLEDQISLFSGLRASWTNLWRDLFGRGGPQDLPTLPATEGDQPATETLARPVPANLLAWSAVVLAVLGFGVGIWFWRRRPRLTATAAYLRLRRAAARAGIDARASVPPLALASAAAAKVPAAAEPTARLVRRYVRESFAGESLADAERPDLAADLAAAVKALRQRRAA